MLIASRKQKPTALTSENITKKASCAMGVINEVVTHLLLLTPDYPRLLVFKNDKQGDIAYSIQRKNGLGFEMHSPDLCASDLNLQA